MPTIDEDLYPRRRQRGRRRWAASSVCPRTHQRVQVYGTVDELNSAIGVALAHGLCDRLDEVLPRDPKRIVRPGVRSVLFGGGQGRSIPLPQIEVRHVTELENLIDEMSAVVGPLQNFILPGGSVGSAQLHVARTICRRAEREAATLACEEGVGEYVLAYLNRLSDALFVMAR